MEVTITLTHESSKFYVTVNLTIIKSVEMKMESRVVEAHRRLRIPDGSEVAPTAAEAACFSGALFALRRADEAGYAVTINYAFGELPSGDLTICAVATSISVLYAVDQQENTTEEVFDGWRLAERNKRGNL